NFFADFALGELGESCAPCASLSSGADFSLAAFALGIGVGVFFSLGEVSVFFCDSSFANFACGIAVGAFSGVAEASRFFPDLLFEAFASGLGDFFGLGDGEAAICSDASRWLLSSSATWARRRLPRIAPKASAVASQMRKRTTAMERNRAHDAINPE